ncbi:odorant-binding protein-like [Cervus canadensis]|uniref:odorant-binding protein-like n=1 Tax=Cervus canadensis TaxID=1574408 RepID=UPI001CA31C0D|nr:odorant-binding protein-like [Cervus canadensis]
MKVVFLTLLLGLVCAVQEEETVDSASTVSATLSGEWSTAYVAYNNLKKHCHKFLLIPYRRYIVFWERCFIILVYVFDCKCHVWRPLHIIGKQLSSNIYTYEYEGTNQIEFIHISKKALIAVNVNVDETGTKTEQVLLFGKDNDIDQEDLETFKKETLSRKITETSIKDLTEPDNYLALA